jgi:aspartyl aminopeptidase
MELDQAPPKRRQGRRVGLAAGIRSGTGPGRLLQRNGVPAIKTNAGLRYATDAVEKSTFLAAAAAADGPVQRYGSRGDLPCGSTGGPIAAAHLGVDTVDAGIGQLAMHSARALCGTEDPPKWSGR